jgi:hypothetical protein
MSAHEAQTLQTRTCGACGTPMFRRFGVTGWQQWRHYTNNLAGCYVITPPRPTAG